MRERAVVSKTTRVTHTRAVGQSVCSVLTAPRIEHVYATSVRTRALASVHSSLSVPSSTTSQHVLARKDTLATHSSHAQSNKHQVNISTVIIFLYNFHKLVNNLLKIFLITDHFLVDFTDSTILHLNRK